MRKGIVIYQIAILSQFKLSVPVLKKRTQTFFLQFRGNNSCEYIKHKFYRPKQRANIDSLCFGLYGY
jgi:hypothetical protein